MRIDYNSIEENEETVDKKDIEELETKFQLNALKYITICQKLKRLKQMVQLRAWLNDNAMFYETFICFYVGEAKPLCFSLCSQMFDDVVRC